MEPPSAQPEIAAVYVFVNGMVMVFDHQGQQIPEFQGRREDVLDRIKAVYQGPIVEDMVWGT